MRVSRVSRERLTWVSRAWGRVWTVACDPDRSIPRISDSSSSPLDPRTGQDGWRNISTCYRMGWWYGQVDCQRDTMPRAPNLRMCERIGRGTGNCPECNQICLEHWELWAEVYAVWRRVPVEA